MLQKKLHSLLGRNPFYQSLDTSWKEGIPASVMQSILDEYLIPLGLFLGATPVQIGFLVAIPNLLGSFSQFLAVKVVEVMGSRLRFLIQATLLQAFFLIPIALLPLFKMPHCILWLIFLVTAFRVAGNLIGTVWGSLASDYLPAEERGKYFGWRSKLAGFAGVGGIILGGVLLFFVGKFSTPAAFVTLFSFAALARFLSSALMSKMQDVRQTRSEDASFTFLMFIRRIRESNFVRYTVYVASIIFATQLAAPFFSVYMLRDLHFNYLVYMAIHLAAVATGYLSLPAWGHHADSVGNAKILKITSLLIPLIPLFWTFSSNLIYLFLIEIFAGFAWGGFNLCSLNFIYDAVSPAKRIRCLSYFTFISGVATFLGAAIGGYLAEHLPPIKGSSILTLFLVSSLMRFLSHFALSPQFHEVRETAKQTSSLELFFSVVGIRRPDGIRKSGINS